MEYNVNARISNHHVHLTKETYEKLFDEDMIVSHKLNQIGEFASNQRLTLRSGDKTIENVRVVGPCRSYNQVEISKRDARFLGILPPIRRSGDLEGACPITLETQKGSVTVNAAIISKPHVHMNNEIANFYGVNDKDVIVIKIKGEKSGSINAEVKVSDNGYFELHIDTDEANAFLIEDNDVVTMITSK